MRKYTVVLLMLLSMPLFAQLEVIEDTKEVIGEVAPMGSMMGELVKDGDIYTLMYKDASYTKIMEIKSFSFKSADDFYNFMMDGMKEKRKDEQDITLDGINFKIDFTRMMGVGSVRFYHHDRGVVGVSPYFTKKQLKKLFGK
ncbi:hypothetical protein [Mesonia sp. K4-1]|uniref:hypothetical protein n=1 Tax=Mesonia sp. K4-1 TaxID=2602760 RepID=UPI0011CABA4B|nr:hypothetical protein [Mesonia sp. K4-1]TXK78723.1 hypothetical protein FT986_02705 [Mesonia sp. K4-1]